MKRAMQALILAVLMPISGLVLTCFTGCTGGSTEPDGEGFSKECKLEFHSFDGGGPEYTVEIADESVISCSYDKKYSKPDHDEMTGAGFDVIYTFKGLKPGKTEFTVSGESPIVPREDYVYEAEVTESLKIKITEKEVKQ